MPQPDLDPALPQAADDSFALHPTWCLRALPDALVERMADLVVADSGLAGDTRNLICRTWLDPEATDHGAERAIRPLRKTPLLLVGRPKESMELPGGVRDPGADRVATDRSSS
jgi:hypothetical protein